MTSCGEISSLREEQVPSCSIEKKGKREREMGKREMAVVFSVMTVCSLRETKNAFVVSGIFPFL